MAVGAFTNFAVDATDFSKVCRMTFWEERSCFQLFPNIKAHLMTLVGQFWFPLRRELLMLAGEKCNDSSKQHIRTTNHQFYASLYRKQRFISFQMCTRRQRSPLRIFSPTTAPDMLWCWLWEVLRRLLTLCQVRFCTYNDFSFMTTTS